MLLQTNLTGHITTLLAAAARLRAQGSGVIVILSSVAAVRPRRANFVYGAAKAGLDAFGRGLADALHGSGVRVLLVRPGFVTGRMTAGLPPAPLAATPGPGRRGGSGRPGTGQRGGLGAAAAGRAGPAAAADPAPGLAPGDAAKSLASGAIQGQTANLYRF